MAFLQVGYKSEAMKKGCAFNAVIPDGCSAENRCPVVYLLHGLSDDHTTWMRRSSIERYAEKYGVAVIMPDGGRSFYTDMKHGGAYYTAIAEELPEFVNRMFPVSRERKDTFIAGLSMGGYGALKIALRDPERFAAAGIMSAVTDIPEKFDSGIFTQELWADIFGTKEDAVKDGNDIFTLLEQVKDRKDAPAVIHFCGDNDFLLQDNRKLNAAFLRLNWKNYFYRETPGVHNWEYWDTHIQDIFQKFFTGDK